MMHFMLIFIHAIYIIQGRWIEAEDVIKTSARYAYYYAKCILKDRWIKAEEVIKIDKYYWNDYKKHFKLC